MLFCRRSRKRDGRGENNKGLGVCCAVASATSTAGCGQSLESLSTLIAIVLQFSKFAIAFCVTSYEYHA